MKKLNIRNVILAIIAALLITAGFYGMVTAPNRGEQTTSYTDTPLFSSEEH